MKRHLHTTLALLAAVMLFSSAAHAQPQQQEFDGIIDAFRVQAGMWQGVLTTAARWLFFTLATMQFCWTNIQLALKGGDISDFISQNTRFVLGTGIMFVFLVHSFDWSNALIKGFLQAGERAVMISAPGTFQAIDPAGIFQSGLVVAGSLFAQMGIWSGAGNVSLVFCAIVMIVCFAFLAALMAVVIVESYIITGGAVLLLGFGGSSWTGDIARKTMMYAVSVGAKLFVMQLIVGVAMGSILSWAETYESSDSTNTLSLIGLVILITVMAKMIPELIQGILSGVSVGGSSAMMATMAAGVAAAAAGTAAVATGGASLAGSGAAAAGSSTAGGATTGAQGAAMFGQAGTSAGALGTGSTGAAGGAGSSTPPATGTSSLGPLGAVGRSTPSPAGGGAPSAGSAGTAGSASPTSGSGADKSAKADGFNAQAAGVGGSVAKSGSPPSSTVTTQPAQAGKAAPATSSGSGSGTGSASASASGSAEAPTSSAPAPQGGDEDPGLSMRGGQPVADSLATADDTSPASPQGGAASTLDDRATAKSAAGHLAKMGGHMVDMGSGFNPNAAAAPLAELGGDEEEPAPVASGSDAANGNLITGSGTPSESGGVESNAKRGAVAGFAVAGPAGAAIGAAAGAALTPQITAASQRAQAALKATKARFGIDQGPER